MITFGVICEGQTDFVAIRSYCQAALNGDGIQAEFVSLQPPLDETLPEAGWGNIARWLEANPFDERILRYWGGGLFEGDLDAKACDAFLVQMDGDHLNDAGFQKFNEDRYSLTRASFGQDHVEYGLAVLRAWMGVTGAESDRLRHAEALAVNSVEAWCAAAFRQHRGVDIEGLQGKELCQLFMDCVHRSESRPTVEVEKSTKDIRRRTIYCQSTASGFGLISDQCDQFEALLNRLREAVNALPT